ncbi:uncharacterized protein [Nicotiana tomentosiformis]|uniref:uncharacterized protein n=1 Tax=Nicotiana tomentosiformis TaxID=4098 RepID=UPI00388C9BAA
MAPYKALYGRQCHSTVGWFEPVEARLLDTNLVRDALEMVKLIQERLRTTQSRHKSHVDRKAHDIAYMVGDKVLLSVSPIKGVMWFEKKGFYAQEYYGDPSHFLDFSMVQLDEDLTYVVESVAILDRQVRKLRSKNIEPVKVHWRGQPVEEATWEVENEMWSKYLHLFETPGMILDSFEDERLFTRGRMSRSAGYFEYFSHVPPI